VSCPIFAQSQETEMTDRAQYKKCNSHPLSFEMKIVLAFMIGMTWGVSCESKKQKGGHVLPRAFMIKKDTGQDVSPPQLPNRTFLLCRYSYYISQKYDKIMHTLS